jgi:hypothetical protein
VCYFLTYLRYQNFLMYALSYTIFIKISHCCYHEICPAIYNQIKIRSYYFHHGTLYFWSHSSLSCITPYCPLVILIPVRFSYNLSYNSKHNPQKDKYVSVYTVGYNWYKLDSLHETVQLLLNCISSHHSRLTKIRSSPTVMHTNSCWTFFISYLAGPLN